MQGPSAAGHRQCVGHTEELLDLRFESFHFPLKIDSVVPEQRMTANHAQRRLFFLFIHVVHPGELKRQRCCADWASSFDGQSVAIFQRGEIRFFFYHCGLLLWPSATARRCAVQILFERIKRDGAAITSPDTNSPESALT